MFSLSHILLLDILTPVPVVRKMESSFSLLNSQSADFCFMFLFPRKAIENLMAQPAVVFGIACDGLVFSFFTLASDLDTTRV